VETIRAVDRLPLELLIDAPVARLGPGS
jgi:hypothetical protein